MKYFCGGVGEWNEMTEVAKILRVLRDVIFLYDYDHDIFRMLGGTL